MKSSLSPVARVPADDKALLAEINELLQAGLVKLGDAFRRASEKWAQLSDATRTKMLNHEDAPTRNLARKLADIATNRLLAPLAPINGFPGMLVAMLPLPEQKRLAENKLMVELALPNGDSRWIAANDLTRAESQQVWERTGHGEARTRTLDEQRAWVAEQDQLRQQNEPKKTEKATLAQPGKWRIEKNRVFFNPERGFRIEDLEKLIAQMKSLRS